MEKTKKSLRLEYITLVPLFCIIVGIIQVPLLILFPEFNELSVISVLISYSVLGMIGLKKISMIELMISIATAIVLSLSFVYFEYFTQAIFGPFYYLFAIFYGGVIPCSMSISSSNPSFFIFIVIVIVVLIPAMILIAFKMYHNKKAEHKVMDS
jgi:hypothetical protein